MWFRGLNYAVPAFFMTLWTIGLGGPTALLAWGIVLYRYWKDHRKIIPIALYGVSAVGWSMRMRHGARAIALPS